MQVPSRVKNVEALAKASSRFQLLAEPRVREATSCYGNSVPESVISPVRQHHPGPCMVEPSGRGGVHKCSVAGIPLHDSLECAAVCEAGVTDSWAADQDLSSFQSMN